MFQGRNLSCSPFEAWVLQIILCVSWMVQNEMFGVTKMVKMLAESELYISCVTTAFYFVGKQYGATLLFFDIF